MKNALDHRSVSIPRQLGTATISVVLDTSPAVMVLEPVGYPQLLSCIVGRVLGKDRNEDRFQIFLQTAGVWRRDAHV